MKETMYIVRIGYKIFKVMVVNERNYTYIKDWIQHF